MKTGISSQEWILRAQKLNLEWVAEPPKRNDEKTSIRCLDCGHVWPVYPANIAKGRKSCAPCSRANSRISKEVWEQRLASGNATWVEGTPENISDKSKLALCQLCNRTWLVNPRQRQLRHPRCLGRIAEPLISPGDWAERAKKVGIEWLEIPTRSKVRTPAQCLTCNHEWSPIPDNIRSGSGCPKCSKLRRSNLGSNKVSDDEWKLRASKAGVEWVSDVPNSTSNRKPVICLKCEYEWSPLASSIRKGSGCPVCAKNASISQKVWDERAAAIGLEWLEPVTGRHSMTKAKCLTCGLEWIVEAGAVARGSGCPECGAKKAQLARRVISSDWIDRAKDLDLEWIQLPENNSIKKIIRCLKCQYQWPIIPASIASGAGCPVCKGLIVEPSTWLLRAAAVKVEWIKTPKSARKPTPAKCLTCGLIWDANPGSIAAGSGCPNCAETGYKISNPGLFYFVERDSSQGRPARKIGITNVSSSKTRLRLWQKQGFVTIHKLTNDDGKLILALEQRLLNWLRLDLGLPPYLDKEEMPKGGWTETFSPDEPSELELLKKIESEYRRLTQEN